MIYIQWFIFNLINIEVKLGNLVGNHNNQIRKGKSQSYGQKTLIKSMQVQDRGIRSRPNSVHSVHTHNHKVSLWAP